MWENGSTWSAVNNLFLQFGINQYTLGGIIIMHFEIPIQKSFTENNEIQFIFMFRITCVKLLSLPPPPPFFFHKSAAGPEKKEKKKLFSLH